MPEHSGARVAIVDYGLGNVFSIENACARVGLDAFLTSEARDLAAADAVILPGVGAFGDAIATLHRLDLVAPLRDVVAAERPVMGVCLGLQLLMTESYEFGVHAGLGLIEGTVEHLGAPRLGDRTLKVPHVGWTPIESSGRPWGGTYLEGLREGTHMYFVHSYRVKPADPAAVLSVSHYGDVTFCSAAQVGAVFACQFHPERSGETGLIVYENLRAATERAARQQPVGGR